MEAPRWLAALLALLPPAVPSLALAEGPAAAAPGTAGTDEISLKDGGVLRGRILSIEPERKAVILLAPAGELRVVPWTEIDHVERGKYAPDAAPPPAPPAPPPPPPADSSPEPLRPGPGTPRVHIEANKRGVALHHIAVPLGGAGVPPHDAAPAQSISRPMPQRQGQGQGQGQGQSRLTALRFLDSNPVLYHSVTAGGPSDFSPGVASEVVCEAPCDQIVDARDGQSFFLTGEGIPRSEHFSLSDQSGDVTVQVSAGSFGERTGGMLLSLGGGPMMLAGAVILPLSLASRVRDPGGYTLTAVSGVMIGVGAAMLIPGILLWKGSRTSYVLKRTPGSALGLRFSNGALLF
jgi:hypothetical protein